MKVKSISSGIKSPALISLVLLTMIEDDIQQLVTQIPELRDIPTVIVDSQRKSQPKKYHLIEERREKYCNGYTSEENELNDFLSIAI